MGGFLWSQIGVVAFSTYAETAYETYTSTVSNCYTSQLAMATPQNIKQLKTYISSLSYGGGTYYTRAIAAAFQLFINTGTMNDEANRSKCICDTFYLNMDPQVKRCYIVSNLVFISQGPNVNLKWLHLFYLHMYQI